MILKEVIIKKEEIPRSKGYPNLDKEILKVKEVRDIVKELQSITVLSIFSYLEITESF